MTAHDHLFLIVSDRGHATSEISDLGQDVDVAMAIYESRERELSGRSDVEVVLVGSASLETLRRTHSSYFGATEAIAPIVASA